MLFDRGNHIGKDGRAPRTSERKQIGEPGRRER